MVVRYAMNGKKEQYKVVTLSEGGSSTKPNEDAFVTNHARHIFGVFDGATSLTGFTDKSGMTDGFIASNIAKKVFESPNNNKELFGLLQEANSEIRRAMLKEHIDLKDKLNLWTTTAAAVKINAKDFSWIQIGDSPILAAYNDGSYRLLVTDYEHDKENLNIWKKIADSGVEPTRDMMKSQFEKVRRQQNERYGCINGEKEIKFLNQGTENLENMKYLLLFTDGLLIPKPDPNKKDDISIIVREYEKGGLKGWFNHVRSLENDDLKMMKFPRFKPFDDCTAVAITFD